MQQNVLFVRNDVMPSWWANAIQKALSTLASPNLRVRQFNATTVEVPAGADDDAVVLMIDGKWRWNEATVQRAHPGGAPGTYKLWATSRNNDIRAVPAPGSDFTNYAFDLAITSGAAPAIVAGTVDIFRPIADLTWDGAAITSIDPFLGGQPRAGSIVNADIAAGAAIVEGKLVLASDAAAGTPSRRTLGAGALQATAGNDSRLSDARVTSDIPSAVLVTDVHVADVYANRPAASAALNGLRFFATDKVMEWQCVAAAWVLVSAEAPIVTALPAGPIDGQRCRLQTAAMLAAKDAPWVLRYNAALAGVQKWQPEGECSLFVNPTGTEAVGPAPANVDNDYTSDIGPAQITVPVSGNYGVTWGARIFISAAGTIYHRLLISPNLSLGEATLGGAANTTANVAIQINGYGFAAGNVIKMMYRLSTATVAGQIDRRWLQVRPLYLG